MACINPNDPEFKKILKQVGGNPLLAAIEFNKLYPEEGAVESEVIKPGVAELFESNPELANAVYESLGFNQMITPNDRIVFGHPTIGKSFLKKQGEDKFISLDDDYSTEINNKVREIANKYNVTTYQVKDGGTQKWNNEYNQMMQEMFNVAKQRAISENKTLFTSNTNLLKNNAESFDKVINLTDKEFERRIQERGAKYDIKRWKSQINDTISKLPTNKVINTDKYLSDLFITPQQKQQAQQQYSQYLDTIFPDSKEKDIFYHGSSESIDPDKLSDFNNQGFYITNDLAYAKAYEKKGVVLRLIINSQYQYKKAEGISEVKETKKDRLDLLKNLEKIKSGELFGGANFGSFATWGDFDVLTPFSFRFFKTKEEFYNANKYDNLTTIDQENVDDIINYVKNRLSEIQAGRAYDTVVTNAEGIWFKAIFDRKKAHFLGSKQDIEGFKEFMDKSTFKQLELDPEMSNYIADQISKAFNVPIPGMEKDTLITAEEIENFNRDVENRDGRLPSEYFTGIDDVNKWVLNKSELYDLVDKDTGEIYLKDVNLSTGQVEKQEVPSQPVSDKERQEAIDYLNNAVKDFRIDEILAERGYDVNDIISNLASAENKEEFDKIINKLLRLLC